MSWLIDFSGNAVETRAQFDAEIERAKTNKMHDGEIADIATAREVVTELANRHGIVSGRASGYWTNNPETGWKFSNLQFTTSVGSSATTIGG